MFVMSPGEFDGGCSCRIFQETRWEPKDYIMDTSNVWVRPLRFKKKRCRKTELSDFWVSVILFFGAVYLM
jgi:hypothetical protein